MGVIYTIFESHQAPESIIHKGLDSVKKTELETQSFTRIIKAIYLCLSTQTGKVTILITIEAFYFLQVSRLAWFSWTTMML